MVQDIANVNGVKTLVSEVKFQKITSGSLFWRNCLNRLVQPKLSFVVYSTRRFVFCLTLCYFVLAFFSPFSIAITSLGEERANLSAFRTFVRFVLVWICLPVGFLLLQHFSCFVLSRPHRCFISVIS